MKSCSHLAAPAVEWSSFRRVSTRRDSQNRRNRNRFLSSCLGGSAERARTWAMRRASLTSHDMCVTYRSQLGDIPSQVLGNRHHLVDNCIGLDFVQHSITVGIVEPEHDCKSHESIIFNQYCLTQHQIILTFQFIFWTSRLQQRQIANDVFEWNFLA